MEDKIDITTPISGLVEENVTLTEDVAVKYNIVSDEVVAEEQAIDENPNYTAGYGSRDFKTPLQ